MANNDIDPRILHSVDEKKRGSLRKMILGTAFAVPMVASFSMDGLVGKAHATINGYISNQTEIIK